MPALRIARRSAGPLYRQVYAQLREAILGGRLPAGARLPSTRALARTLRVSRNTILNAYEALIADALLAARQGSGTRVCSPSDKILPLAAPMRKPFDLWAALREARFPTTSACLRDPDGNPLYLLSCFASAEYPNGCSGAKRGETALSYPVRRVAGRGRSRFLPDRGTSQ
jgi:DNA-binding transcriptional regulator YhcF (GntR family)